jgi:electron transport complex protein RnfG
MTLGVCFDPKGLVKGVRVLSSEEERGKPVAEKGFLKQFDGKKVSDAFQVGRDVDGVSGATYSSRSVSESVRRASYGFKTFVQK